jgi:flavin-dependent dehydrogenase
VFVAWPIAEMRAVRQDIEGEFMAVVDRVPELAEHVRSGRREERFYGASDLPNYLRRPHGPGWALVGDAGCHKDPFRALGICDAFRDAELLSRAVADGFSGRCSLEAGLAEYERKRNEATLPDYRQNLERARFTPFPAEVLRLRAAIRGDQTATNQFYLANEGMIVRDAFFNPETMQRLMARASFVPLVDPRPDP